MLRESNMQTLTWADKTMSLMKERQLEACEDRLSSLPDFSLFDDIDDTQAEALWECSFDAQEHPRQRELHTIDALRGMVVRALPAEAALLSVAEHQLLERLLALGGEAELMDAEESGAAEALVRRMWCTISWDEEDRAYLYLPPELLLPLQAIVSSQPHQELRRAVCHYDAAIRGLLYVGGLLQVDEALRHLLEDKLKGTYADHPGLGLRFLRTSFDYTYDERGDMLLLHPGLAEPERLLHIISDIPFMTAALSEEILVGAVNGMLPEERPLAEKMYRLLAGAVRPEITVPEAVEDLLMLAKQGVGLTEMNEVLSSLLTVRPTEAMLEGVRQLYLMTPRWGTMRSGVVQ